MQDLVVFVVEKSSVVRALAPLLSKYWPDKQLYAITTTYIGLYEFRYPRGLSFNDFPYVAEPGWKARQTEDGFSGSWEIRDGTASKSYLEPSSLLREAETVWCAVDPDASGVIAYHVLLTQCLSEAEATVPRPALRIYALDAESIESALRSCDSTANAWFIEARNAGIARRFFDFNFNINSFSLFGVALRRAGVSESGMVTVSKYGLQLLYGLRGQAAASEGALVHSMQNWRGTGRYAPTALGSPASRDEILFRLQSAGLVVTKRDGGVLLSEKGESFLQQLHPDCCDPDLPTRLRQWEASWPASRPNIVRYLRTFFGKQKRFSAKTPA